MHDVKNSCINIRHLGLTLCRTELNKFWNFITKITSTVATNTLINSRFSVE